MKKIAFSLLVAATFCYSHYTFSGSVETINPDPILTGFYVGGNVGYWWSQNTNVTTNVSSSFVNQTFVLGASNIVQALTHIATNNFSLHSEGIIGGIQVGYNYQFNNDFLFGFDIDFDGLSNSHNTYLLVKQVDLIDFDESYAASLVFKQRINYLGTMRARFGYLYCPTFLIYATGGFNYGNVTLDTAWTVQESLGVSVFPTIATQHNVSKTLVGWSAGAGGEWFFKPGWSARIEYSYYHLNNENASVTLSQINESTSPPLLWGKVAANTALSVSAGTVRVGINYHFC